MMIVSPIPILADSAQNADPKLTCPTEGANCRRIDDKYAMRGSSRHAEERGVRRMVFRDSENTSLPRFRSDCGDRILLLVGDFERSPRRRLGGGRRLGG